MTTLDTIETGVMNLSRKDLAKFRQWFSSFDADAWDAQIEKDALDGKLDALANEAVDEYRSGKAREI